MGLFLQEKYEIFETFKKFKMIVQKEAGCEIKRLWTDQGGEYTY